jgi:signal transduction histidine kinase
VNLRARILIASGLAALVPVAILAFGIRREMTRRLTEQYTERVETIAAVIADDLADRSRDLEARLAALRAEIAADNRFRLAAVGRLAAERPYLLDFAGRAMNLTGISMLQIQDADGRIISSGHFRNEYDRMEPALPQLLEAAPGGAPVLVRARRPDGAFLALARVDSLQLGGKRFTIIGGSEVDRTALEALARDPDLAVSLVYPGGAISSDPEIEEILSKWSRTQGGMGPAVPDLLGGEYVVRTLDLPAALPGASARLVVSHPLAPLNDLLGSLDRWLWLVLVTTASGALLLALWVSSRISGPIDALARKTAQIDLDHLDTDFSSNRTDEVGVLSRFLGAMTQRLRARVAELREVERRATLGELARQVNHDLRNGVAPIQNVVRHLGQVARERPLELSGVFLERQATIETSLAYLEDLAANYARLSPQLKREPLDLNAVVRDVAPAAGQAAKVAVQFKLVEPLPRVSGDPIGLRRIVENLVRNARESLEEDPGTITLTTGTAANHRGEALVLLTVADTGRGLQPEERSRIFDHFYTTKAGGTGLGLSIVRRLVSDFDGTVSVDSEPGRGTRFTVSFPAAADPARKPESVPEDLRR